MQPHLHLPNLTPRVIALRLHAALGASLDAEVEVSTPEPLDGEALTGSPVRLELHADAGEIAAFHGIVASLTLTATANPDAQRPATLHVGPSFAPGDRTPAPSASTGGLSGCPPC